MNRFQEELVDKVKLYNGQATLTELAPLLRDSIPNVFSRAVHTDCLEVIEAEKGRLGETIVMVKTKKPPVIKKLKSEDHRKILQRWLLSRNAPIEVIRSLEFFINKGKKESGLGKDEAGRFYKRPVIQRDLDGEIIKKWGSASDAVFYGYDSGAICKCCKGTKKTHKKSTWEYALP